VRAFFAQGRRSCGAIISMDWTMAAASLGNGSRQTVTTTESRHHSLHADPRIVKIVILIT
jgi:hypothetical protein